MSKPLQTGQYRRIATVNFDFASFPPNTQYVLSLPEDSLIFGGGLVITEAFDSAGTDTLSVGTSAAPARNLAATSLKAAAVTALTANTIANGDRLLFTRALGAGAAPTKGKGFLYIAFMGPRINDFNVGDVWEPWIQQKAGVVL